MDMMDYVLLLDKFTFSLFSHFNLMVACFVMAVVHFNEGRDRPQFKWTKTFIGVAWLGMAVVFGIFCATDLPQPIPRLMSRFFFGMLVVSYIGYKLVLIEIMVRESRIWKKLRSSSLSLLQLLHL